MRTSAVGGSSGLGSVGIGKTKTLAVNDSLVWDGSTWTNAVVSGGGGLTSVSTNSTLEGDGTPGNVLGIKSAFTTPSTLSLEYDSTIQYDQYGRVVTSVPRTLSNSVWVIEGDASVASTTIGAIPGTLTLTAGAPYNNPSTAFSLTNMRFQAPWAGLFNVSINANFPGVTASTVGAGYLGIVNVFGGSTTIQAYNIQQGVSTVGQLFSVSGQTYVSATEGFRVYLFQNSGSAQTAHIQIIVSGTKV